MQSATIHPTPQSVVDAIQVVAKYLREIEAAEAVISPTGGASFHPERHADALLGGWAETRAVLAELISAADEGHVCSQDCPLCPALKKARDFIQEGA